MDNEYHITTGDIDGIGLEVTLKALLKLKDRTPKSRFFIWVHQNQLRQISKFTKKFYDFEKKIAFLSQYSDSNKKFNFILSAKNEPAHWFVLATKICLQSKAHLITAPLSKTQIRKEGFSQVGHTEILKDLCKNRDLNMVFLGRHFSIVLYTDHIPITQLEVDPDSFVQFVRRSLHFHKSFKSKNSAFNILGLNPHSGDSGLIGKEDLILLERVSKNFRIERFLPADSAFVGYEKFKNNPTFLAMYHDQGLIPFKMAHGYTGFHYTLGLPFVRTSVDHGTAKEIFGKNRANPDSMIDAILGAIRLSKKGSRL